MVIVVTMLAKIMKVKVIIVTLIRVMVTTLTTVKGFKSVMKCMYPGYVFCQV